MKTILLKLICIGLLFSTALLEGQEKQSSWSWKLQATGVDASLRGLCVLDNDNVWASGSGGTVIRTINGGETWQNVSVPNADEFDFRDIQVLDAQTAVISNAGQPAVFYRTEDGGQTWTKVFEHEHEKAFFDCLTQISPTHLIAMSDPVDERVLLVESTDAGKTWSVLPSVRRPEVIPGEAGFAASGSNMIYDKQSKTIYLAMGSASEGEKHKTSRVLISDDAAQTWRAEIVEMERTQSSGIFSMCCLEDGAVIAVGGDYLNPENGESNLSIRKQDAWSRPANRTRGYRSGVNYFRTGEMLIIVAVGPDGTDISYNSGETFNRLNDVGFHAVKSFGRGTIWASGSEGRVATLITENN